MNRLNRIVVFAALLFSCQLAAADSNAPVADAAEARSWSRVADLIGRHVDVNAAQVDGMTALHWAVYHDDIGTTKRLIKAGANAKAASEFGVAPLSVACTNGNTEIVEALLKAGADPNTSLRGGETALMTAARTGRVGPIKALLAHGAKVDAKDRKRQSAIMWAAADGHAEAVQALIAAGGDFRARLPSGFTALLFAARDGRSEVVRVLLKAGADVNDAVQAKKTVSRGPRIGTSALLMAVENGHFELAIELVKAGADPNDQRAGFAALHMVSWVRKPNRGDDEAGDPPPIGSGKLTSLEFVRKIVALGANINLPQKKGAPERGVLTRVGATPLIAAASTSDVELMRTLLELGADPNRTNADGTTALLAAAGVGVGAPEEAAGSEMEAMEVVKILLKLGGDPNVVDKNGDTAMHGAACRNHPKVVQLLADNGAKIDVWNRPNKSGFSPLVIAEGFRQGLNFRPSPPTVEAFHRVMLAAGITPPKTPPRPIDLLKPAYGDKAKQPR